MVKKKVVITYIYDSEKDTPEIPESISEKPAAVKCRKHKVMMELVWSKKKKQWFSFHEDKNYGFRCWGNGYASNYQGIK